MMATTYEPRPPASVEAMMLDGTAAGNETVRVWVRSLLGEDSVAVPNAMSYSTVVMQQNGTTLIARGDQYVYWDGTTMHVADKLAFEMYYMPAA